MLLLIPWANPWKMRNLYSNTSHVTINQYGTRKMYFSKDNSNTSHVTINHNEDLFNTLVENSNTSHVTINLIWMIKVL